MSGYQISERFKNQLYDTVLAVQGMAGAAKEPEREKFYSGDLTPQRGILLDSIVDTNGLALIGYKDTDVSSWIIAVLGDNEAARDYTIDLTLTIGGGGGSYTFSDISIETTAKEFRQLLIDQSRGLFTENNLSVSGGNPYVDETEGATHYAAFWHIDTKADTRLWSWLVTDDIPAYDEAETEIWADVKIYRDNISLFYPIETKVCVPFPISSFYAGSNSDDIEANIKRYISPYVAGARVLLVPSTDAGYVIAQVEHRVLEGLPVVPPEDED